MTHPAGHSYGQDKPRPSAACSELPESWATCSEYLLGVDLFNRAYLWEAHEAWEVAWKAVGSETLCGRFLQSLIQVSASLLRRHLQTPDGARHLMAKAAARFDEVEGWMHQVETREYMGVNLSQWRHLAQEYLERGGGSYPFLKLGI